MTSNEHFPLACKIVTVTTKFGAPDSPSGALGPSPTELDTMPFVNERPEIIYGVMEHRALAAPPRLPNKTPIRMVAGGDGRPIPRAKRALFKDICPLKERND